ncbi:MAG: YecA family protein [Candidatus Protistobacter heckmanni]|nr:YecA family protein [Candidatus Protistobacter heckmanni]
MLYEIDTEEVIMIDMMDGFLHAISIGPTTMHPGQWLPKIWGSENIMPPMESLDQLNHV